jgi:hypothetical protein
LQPVLTVASADCDVHQRGWLSPSKRERLLNKKNNFSTSTILRFKQRKKTVRPRGKVQAAITVWTAAGHDYDA